MFKNLKVVPITARKLDSKQQLRKETAPHVRTGTLICPVPDEADEDCESHADSITSAQCLHCGAILTFPGFNAIYAFICKQCGEPVEVNHPIQ